MKTCVICGKLLEDKDRSCEHIIHNALGGSLTDDMIYCKECNGKYGSSCDKAFIRIFAPIVDHLNMHKTRKTKGTSYTGKVCDEEGNVFSAKYKDGRIIELKDSDLKYVKPNKKKYRTLYYDFDLDNDTFKQGMAKIAFNYAVYCGIEVSALEKVFDYSMKKIVDKPVVIPFVPLTPFDCIMEMHPVNRISHTIRIFNYENFLYAYVELFNTFQTYVVLSEKYDFIEQKNIDKSDSNVVEMNAPIPIDKTLLEMVTPKDYKDVDIIKNQYQINVNKLIDDLRKYHNYDDLNQSEQVEKLFLSIGKKVYEQLRKQSYRIEYEKQIKQQYDSIDFSDIVCNIGNDIERISEFFESFKFYTIYSENCINLERYKRIHPSRVAYPIAICDILDDHLRIKKYGHRKFRMLEKCLSDEDEKQY